MKCYLYFVLFNPEIWLCRCSLVKLILRPVKSYHYKNKDIIDWYFQLFLGFFHVGIASNIISGSMLAWSSLTDWDFGVIISYIVPFVRQLTGIHILLSIIEAVILRCLTEFVWKRIPPLENEFTTFFLTSFNILLGLLLPIITCNSGSFSELERLQGKSSYLKGESTLNPK